MVVVAAPELLEACKDYLELLEDEYRGVGGRDLSGGAIKDIENLIAKAEGRN